jgi:hypothetical protein
MGRMHISEAEFVSGAVTCIACWHLHFNPLSFANQSTTLPSDIRSKT